MRCWARRASTGPATSISSGSDAVLPRGANPDYGVSNRLGNRQRGNRMTTLTRRMLALLVLLLLGCAGCGSDSNDSSADDSGSTDTTKAPATTTTVKIDEAAATAEI